MSKDLDKSERVRKSELVSYLRSKSIPLQSEDAVSRLDQLTDNSQIVLLGKGSHGTSEYIRTAAEISKHLISEKGFNGVAVEWDYIDCLAINNYISSEQSRYVSASEALTSFGRNWKWMWANAEFANFVDWLKEENIMRSRSGNEEIHFFGLDSQSFYQTKKVSRTGIEQKIISIQENTNRDLDWFNNFLNLVTVKEMMTRSESSELEYDNMRATHMHLLIEMILGYYPRMKLVGILHNTHVGDARATDYTFWDQNLGQFLRTYRPNDGVTLIGMCSSKGTVGAVDDPDLSKMQVKKVKKPLSGSWEELFYQANKGEPTIYVFDEQDRTMLSEVRPFRAVGALSNGSGVWVPTNLANRFDAVIHIPKTKAVTPL